MSLELYGGEFYKLKNTVSFWVKKLWHIKIAILDTHIIGTLLWWIL